VLNTCLSINTHAPPPFGNIMLPTPIPQSPVKWKVQDFFPSPPPLTLLRFVVMYVWQGRGCLPKGKCDNWALHCSIRTRNWYEERELGTHKLTDELQMYIIAYFGWLAEMIINYSVALSCFFYCTLSARSINILNFHTVVPEILHIC